MTKIGSSQPKVLSYGLANSNPLIPFEPIVDECEFCMRMIVKSVIDRSPAMKVTEAIANRKSEITDDDDDER